MGRSTAFITISLLTMLAGCGSFSVPASGVTTKGEKFYGQATASMSEGKFIVTNQAGVICTGNYDQMSMARDLTVTFTCTDKRTGTLQIHRNPDLMGGVGTGVFSDGTTGTFKFGRDSGA